MATFIQKLRGTAEDLLKYFTPAKVPPAVLAINMDNFDIHISDGKTAGGLPVLGRAEKNMQQYVAAEIAKYLGNVARIPAGLVAPFAMNNAPAGWLKCNGDWVSRADYADLYAAIGDIYGADSEGINFKLPELRGEFIRGYMDDRKVGDTSSLNLQMARPFGQPEDVMLKWHSHQGVTDYRGGHSHQNGVRIMTYGVAASGGARAVESGFSELGTGAGGDFAVHFTTDSGNQNEGYFGLDNRPHNLNLLFCIKT